MRRHAHLLALTTAFCWSFAFFGYASWIATLAPSKQSESVAVVLVVAYRLTAATLLFLPILMLAPTKDGQRRWLTTADARTLSVAILGAVPVYHFTLAALERPSMLRDTKAAAVNLLVPLFVAILASFRIHRSKDASLRRPWTDWPLLALGLFGACLLIRGDLRTISWAWLPALIVPVTLAYWTHRISQSRDASSPSFVEVYGAFRLTAQAFILGTIIALPAVLVAVAVLSDDSIVSTLARPLNSESSVKLGLELGGMVIGSTIIGYSLWARASEIGARQGIHVGAYLYLMPAMTWSMTYLIRGEDEAGTFHREDYLGLSLIVLALIMSRWLEKPKPEQMNVVELAPPSKRPHSIHVTESHARSDRRPADRP